MITSEQIKAARGLLRWSQQDLATAAGVGLDTVKRIERVHGPVNAHTRTVGAMQRAIQDAGVAFTNGDEPGVKLARRDG